ncbi:MAG: DUF5996 family protein [Candidatus Promineifilaceae bacterium]|nr:DUF5996 family protein [Candidatus Promineifilaceae bacterium]
MVNSLFPPLPLDEWQQTRDTIRGYAVFAGKIRRALIPSRKHWWHASLLVAAPGLTTTPIRVEDKTFELLLDFTHHRLLVTTSHGQRREFPLTGQSLLKFKEQALSILSDLGIKPEIDHGLFASDDTGVYDKTAVSRYWQALSQIDAVLKEFSSGFRAEASPVQFWPHHFDLAVNWFSGRLVPGEDVDDPEMSDEQMNFGFSTGDGSTPNPYFYITAYPRPEGWLNFPIEVKGAYWQTEGWNGAVLPYDIVSKSADGRALLFSFLNSLQKTGAKFMLG